MRPDELMVGNWVNADGRKEPSVVIELSPKFPSTEIMVEYNSALLVNRKPCSYPGSMIHPIPLTAEILEKNGFVRFGTSYVLEGEHFGLENPSSPGDYKDNYWLRIGEKDHNILYVHQLQNVLRLIGINKEITI